MRAMVRHVIGCDLGTQGDYSAAALLKYAPVPKPVFEVPTLHRWPLGVAYKRLGQDLARFLAEPDLADAELVIDATGVGLAVVEIVLEALAEAHVTAQVGMVTITGGNAVSQAGRGHWHVSKRVLVSNLSAVVHSGRLKVAQDQPEAATLLRELQTFRAKISLVTGNEEFSAWRERDHDDTVLAVALGCWWPTKPRQRVQVDHGPLGDD